MLFNSRMRVQNASDEVVRPQDLADIARHVIRYHFTQESSNVCPAVALGFIKVAAVRLPQTDLAEQLPTLVPAMLSCCDDDAGFNRFRSKVRVVVERLVKRCGWSAVEAGPAGYCSLCRLPATSSTRILNPCLLSYMEYYDVASIICQAHCPPRHRH